MAIRGTLVDWFDSCDDFCEACPLIGVSVGGGGPRDYAGEIMLVIDNRPEELREVFGEVTVAATVTNEYSVPCENNVRMQKAQGSAERSLAAHRELRLISFRMRAGRSARLPQNWERILRISTRWAVEQFDNRVRQASRSNVLIS